MFNGRRRKFFSRSAGFGIGLALFCNASPQTAQAQVDRPLPTVAESSNIFLQLEPELQRFVDQQPRLPGQKSRISARITPDPSTGIVWIDLDSGFIPKGQNEFSQDFGDKLGEIEAELYEFLSGVIGFKYVIARIGGRSINEIFPPERLLKRKEQRSARAAATRVPGLVVINPGNGKYFHYGENAWEYERPTPYVGTTDVHEDDITPRFASLLNTWLTSRSRDFVTEVRQTRAIGNPFIEEESNLPWKDLAARYHIKALLPEEGPTIWNRFPNGLAELFGSPRARHVAFGVLAVS